MKEKVLSEISADPWIKSSPASPSLRLATFIIILVFLTFNACKQENSQNPQPKGKNAVPVKIQPAQKTKMVSNIEITGTVQANVFTEVSSSAEGVIESLYVRENQYATKGEIIAVINPEDRLALTAENQLRIEQLKEQIRNTDRDSDIYYTLEQELKEAKDNLAYAQNMYQTIPVVSPMSGLVTYRWLDRGSQVAAKEKIITITDMNSLVVKAEVNEKYFEALKQGRPLPVILNAYPNDTIKGTISLVYPQIKPETRSVKFDISLMDFNKKLLPGMMAVIRIPVSVKKDAVSVPDHAVLTSPDNKNFLFVVGKDSVASRRIIETGMSTGNKLEILRGLDENEKVVVAGQEMLKDGMKVAITGQTQEGKK